MDPATAIGLASAILSFVTFTTSLVKGAIEIRDGLDGDLEDNRRRRAILEEMINLSAELPPRDDPQLSREEKSLRSLAAECKKLAEEVVGILDRVKSKDAKSVTQNVFSKFRDLLSRKERDELENRLDACRSQFGVQLTYVTSQETRASLEDLMRSTRDGASATKQLHASMDQLRRGVEVASISKEVQDQFRRLIGLEENVLGNIAKERILRSLAFDNMHGRYEMVEDAHADTFAWIFPDGSKPRTLYRGHISSDRRHGRDAEQGMWRHEASAKFINWLSSTEGIFHVSGKLGSGKSTLMKFLCEHPRTRAELGKWAGGRKLGFSNFFFWRQGTLLQKSLAGLFRSLLHDSLKECPEQIPHILPEIWKQVREAPWQVQLQLEIPEKEIRLALDRLVDSKALYDHHCLCFFIDGLDEYEGAIQQDYSYVVELLCRWTTASPGSIKLCVSSREYPVFMNAFPIARRFRLHELTRHDMEKYVRDRLPEVPHKDERDYLVHGIPEKAQGIFLWVTLVVRSMRERAEYDVRPGALKELLETLPEELEQLFEHILRHISRPDRKRAYQTMAMLPLSKQYELPITLLAYSFLDDYGSNPEFAQQDDFPKPADRNVSREERIELSQKRLNGVCKGLIEPATHNIRGYDPADLALDYAHRSIPDYLNKSPTFKADMKSDLEGFDAAHALSQLILALIRLGTELFKNMTYVLIKMRLESGLDKSPYAFLECLAASNPDIALSNPGELAIKHEFGAPLSPITSLNIKIDDYFVRRSPEDFVIVKWGYTIVRHPLLIAASLRHGEYVKWKLSNDSRITPNSTIIICLTYCLLTGPELYDQPEWTLLCHLLEQGFITVDSRTNVPLFLDANPIISGELTLWQHYLAFEFRWWFLGLKLKSSEITQARLRRMAEIRRARLSRVAEMFLGRGADCRFAVLASDLNREKKWVDIEFELGNETLTVRKLRTDEKLLEGWDKWEKEGEKRRIVRSLRHFILLLDPPNKERLLQLVDKGDGGNGDGAEHRGDEEGSRSVPALPEAASPQGGEEPKRGSTAELDSKAPTETAGHLSSALGLLPALVLVPLLAILIYYYHLVRADTSSR